MQSVKLSWTIHTNVTQKPMTFIVTGMKTRMQEKVSYSNLRRSEFGRKSTSIVTGTIPQINPAMTLYQPFLQERGWRKKTVLEKWTWKKRRKKPQRTSPERQNSFTIGLRLTWAQCCQNQWSPCGHFATPAQHSCSCMVNQMSRLTGLNTRGFSGCPKNICAGSETAGKQGQVRMASWL